MRILAVNVRAGGTSTKIDALLERAISYEASIYVFSEFRDTASGARIRAVMRESGLAYQAYSAGHRGNGVLVAASAAFTPIYNPAGFSHDAYPAAMIECVFGDLHVIGCYLPGQDRKRPHLSYLINFAGAANDASIPAMAIGDFNSGRNATDIEANVGRKRLADEFSTAGLYAALEERWTEAWVHCNPGVLEYSWYPRMGRPERHNGWRLDKAFVSSALLPDVTNAFYDHEFRLERLTDHSALIVDLNV